MVMTDPVADMLTRIRNGNMAYHDTVVMPTSTLKEALARVLVKEGYVERYETRDRVGRPGRELVVHLKYTNDRKRTITGIKRISKPGLRVYSRSDQIPRVLGGMGVAVLSTSQGVITGHEARRRGIGGEVICTVW